MTARWIRRLAAVSVLCLGLAACTHSAQESTRSASPTSVYTGPSTLSTPGTVLSGVTIRQPLRITADNVTIRDSLISTATSANYDTPVVLVDRGAVGTRIVHNVIQGAGDQPGSAASSGVKLYGDDTVFQDNEVRWIAGDGLTMDGTGLSVTGNTIHDFVYRAGVHYDAVVYAGSDTTNTVVIKDNTIELWVADGMTSALSLPDSAPNMLVQSNLLAGGGYTIEGGGNGVRFEGNSFSTRFSATCGSYGVATRVGLRGVVTWQDNKWADGPHAGGAVPLD